VQNRDRAEAETLGHVLDGARRQRHPHPPLQLLERQICTPYDEKPHRPEQMGVRYPLFVSLRAILHASRRPSSYSGFARETRDVTSRLALGPRVAPLHIRPGFERGLER
jgi:hypothetical protein